MYSFLPGFLFFSLVLLLCEPLSSQQLKPGVLDLINLEIPSSPVISPDGAQAAYIIRKPSADYKNWESVLYLMNVKTQAVQPVTSPKFRVSSPRFSPDGNYLYYIYSAPYFSTEKKDTVKNSSQVWRYSIKDGAATAVTSLSEGVEEYNFSNDGTRLAVLTTAEEPELRMTIGGTVLTADESIFPKKNPEKILAVYILPEGRMLFNHSLDPGAQDVIFSPDNSRIIYQSNLTGDYNDEQKFDLYSIDGSGKKKQLTNYPGPETEAQFSPDGKNFIFKSQTVPDIEFAETDIEIMNPDGTGRKNLTADYNFNVQSYIWRNKTSFLFIGAEYYNSVAYEMDIRTGKKIRISPAEKSVSDLSATTDGRIFWREESPETISELVLGNKKLTSFSAQLKEFKSGTQEAVLYKSSDGKFELNGILFKPDGFDPSKKYPMVVTIHGGPYGYFRNVYQQSYPTKVLTSLGYLVFAPNPRGSLGGSDEFGQANRYDLGGSDYRDIMDGVEHLIGIGFVDAGRLGVMGGSYGGYLTNWTISQTTLFKAAVSMYGIFSFFTDWSNSWQPVFEKMYFGYYYWERPIDMSNLYVNRSPAFYADKIKTPTLILQGEKDLYTDVSNSREMFQALNTLGVPVEFALYPGEGHGIRNKPYHYANVLSRSVAWFEKYLK